MLKIAIAFMLMGSLLLVQDETAKTQDDDNFLKDVKCVMNAKGAADEEHFVEYKECKLYFCCGNCPKTFAKMIEKDKEKFAEKFAHKANRQLVSTKQFEQTACPFSGGPIKEGTTVEVAGVKVGFCCSNCQGKVENTKESEDQSSMVFNEESFKKGFKKKGSDEKKKG